MSNIEQSHLLFVASELVHGFPLANILKRLPRGFSTQFYNEVNTMVLKDTSLMSPVAKEAYNLALRMKQLQDNILS